MDAEMVCSRINRLLGDAGYNIYFQDIGNIENFLSDKDNFGHETYEVIEQLYSQLMEDTEI